MLVMHRGMEEFMGYLDELHSFFEHIQNNSARSLSRDQLIESFLEYMCKEYRHNEEYFREQFDKESADYKDFDEFIYKCYMGLTRDLRREYENVEREAKERVQLYKERVSNLQHMVDVVSPSEKYEKQKYIFFGNINKELLEKATEFRKKDRIFWRALNNCRKKSWWLAGEWLYRDEFSDIQQYVDIDWK